MDEWYKQVMFADFFFDALQSDASDASPRQIIKTRCSSAASACHSSVCDDVLCNDSSLCRGGSAHTSISPECDGLLECCTCRASACLLLQIITPFNIYFNFYFIFHKYEFWRLLTNFLFFGNLGTRRFKDATPSSLLRRCH